MFAPFPVYLASDRKSHSEIRVESNGKRYNLIKGLVGNCFYEGNPDGKVYRLTDDGLCLEEIDPKSQLGIWLKG